MPRIAISFLEIVSLLYIGVGLAVFTGYSIFVSLLLSFYGIVAPLELVASSFSFQGGSQELIWGLGILSIAGGVMGFLGAGDIYRGVNRKRGDKIWFFISAISVVTAGWNIFYVFTERNHLLAPALISLGWAFSYSIAYYSAKNYKIEEKIV